MPKIYRSKTISVNISLPVDAEIYLDAMGLTNTMKDKK